MQEWRGKGKKMGLGMRREGEEAAPEEQHLARVVLEQKMGERMRGKHGIKSKFDAGIHGRGSAESLGLSRGFGKGGMAGMGRSRDHPIPPPTDAAHPR